MTLPLSGPLAMSMFADEVDLPLSSVRISHTLLREIADKIPTDSKIAFSDFYGKGAVSDYTVTIGGSYPNSVVMNSLSYIVRGYIAANAPDLYPPGTAVQLGDSTKKDFKGNDIFVIGLGDMLLPPFADCGIISIKGAHSVLSLSSVTFSKMDGSSAVTLTPQVANTKFVAATGTKPAVTTFYFPLGSQLFSGYGGDGAQFKVAINW